MAFEQTMYIYGLVDPYSNCLRYIGKTKNISDRFNLHLSTARTGGKKHKDRWILGLLNKGTVPTMVILEEVTGKGDIEECFWIAFVKTSGAELLNIKEGGSRANNSPQTRKKISASNKGKKRSPEALSNYKKAAQRRGNSRPPGTYKHTEETKRKMSASQKKVPMTPKRLAQLKKAREARRKKK